MDYKYIEQLLERYWDCQTTLQEEVILKTFFASDDVPAHLQDYKAVFRAMDAQDDATLGEAFDAKVLQAIAAEEQSQEHRVVALRPISSARRFRPFYKAAASVAIVLAIGMAVQRSTNNIDEATPASVRSVAGIEQGAYQSPGDVNNAENHVSGQVSASLTGEKVDSLSGQNASAASHDY